MQTAIWSNQTKLVKSFVLLKRVVIMVAVNGPVRPSVRLFTFKHCMRENKTKQKIKAEYLKPSHHFGT